MHTISGTTHDRRHPEIVPVARISHQISATSPVNCLLASVG